MRKVQLVRALDGGRKEMMIIPVDLIYKGKSPDVALKDGDILFVPTSVGRLATVRAISAALGIGTAVTIYKVAYGH